MCHHDDDDDDDDLLEVEQGEMGEKLQEGMWQWGGDPLEAKQLNGGRHVEGSISMESWGSDTDNQRSVAEYHFNKYFKTT